MSFSESLGKFLPTSVLDAENSFPLEDTESYHVVQVVFAAEINHLIVSGFYSEMFLTVMEVSKHEHWRPTYTHSYLQVVFALYLLRGGLEAFDYFFWVKIVKSWEVNKQDIH